MLKRTIGDGVVTIDYASRPGREGRDRYLYRIEAPGVSHEDDDLQSGCNGGTLEEGLRSLLSFLSAAVESRYYRERVKRKEEPDPDSNEGLFPPLVVDWASDNHDEIQLAAMEMEEAE